MLCEAGRQHVVYLAKWSCLAVQAVLVAIAMVVIGNRRGDTMAEFAIGIAASVLPIAAHDRPFTEQIL
jgi:hypothetical protein